MADYTGRDQRLKYLFQNGGGGGGTVSDGTVGVRIDYRFESGETKAFTYDELGITAQGLYLLAITTSNVGEYGWYYFGYISYGGTGSNGIKITQLLNRNYSLSANQTNNTLSITNTHGTWYIQSRIEVLPLHPKVEIPKHTYSTTEQVVGTWVDGKPIYETTVSIGTLPNSAWLTVNHGISDIESIVRIEGYARRPSDNTVINLPFVGSSYVSVNANLTSIAIQATSDRSTFTESYVTLRYTKTTD